MTALRRAVRGQPHRVRSRKDHGSVLRRTPQNHAREGDDGRRVEIPSISINAGCHGGALWTAESAAATTATRRGLFARLWRRLAVDRPHDLPLGVEELNRQVLWLRGEVVADTRPLQAANDVRWLVENDRACRWRAELAQRRQVVHHVEATPMRANRERVVFNDEVGCRCIRQAILERSPPLAIVERNVDTVLRAGIEQASSDGILANSVHVIVGGDAVDDLRPRLAVVACPEDVRRTVAEEHLFHGDVSRSIVE